jgi:hypothetical protein
MTAVAGRSRVEPLYKLLAGAIGAYHRCKASGNTEWLNKHADAVERMCKDVLPSGSGIDSGCTIDLDECTEEKIVIHASFHHMNDGGMYDGWTEHTITARPSFIGQVDLTITGRNRNDIKDCLSETFHHVLTEQIEESYDEPRDRLMYRFARLILPTSGEQS